MTIKYLSESEVIEVFEAGIEVLVCEDEYGVDFSISDGDYSLRDVQDYINDGCKFFID